MTDQKVPEGNVNSILTKATKGNISESDFAALLSIMMAKEVRIAEKESALEQALQARDQQRRRDSENYTIAKIEAQKNCKHLKGGTGRQRAQAKDPAVYFHIFTDRTQAIKCNLCGARWLPGDTDEYLTRNGSKIPNWTGIGWRRAWDMAEDSSNKMSSSERFAKGTASPLPKSVEGLEVPNLQI
jgi:hypothetical protein